MEYHGLPKFHGLETQETQSRNLRNEGRYVMLWPASQQNAAQKITCNYFTSCDPHHDIYTFCY